MAVRRDYALIVLVLLFPLIDLSISGYATGSVGFDVEAIPSRMSPGEQFILRTSVWNMAFDPQRLGVFVDVSFPFRVVSSPEPSRSLCAFCSWEGVYVLEVEDRAPRGPRSFDMVLDAEDSSRREPVEIVIT